MTTAMLKAILILPGLALVYVPALLLWLSAGTRFAASFPPQPAWLVAGIVLGAAGLGLMVWTIRLFATRGGGGTLAPWDPIQNLILEGPYKYVRNPMLSGVNLCLAAETLLLQSWPLAFWMVFFVALNTVYFALHEEPGLEARYGQAYAAYKREVPRWLPRQTPYRAEGDPGSGQD